MELVIASEYGDATGGGVDIIYVSSNADIDALARAHAQRENKAPGKVIVLDFDSLPKTGVSARDWYIDGARVLSRV